MESTTRSTTMSRLTFVMDDNITFNDLDKYFDHYIVIGFIYNTNKKFRKQFERSIDAFSINLWRGKVWGVRFGRRKRLKSVYN